jgi:hypothetical protein
MTRRHPATTHARRYWRITVILLIINLLLFLLATAFISARPVLSLVFGGLNAVALGCLVWVDRRVVHLGLPSFWKNGRPRRPD